MFEYAVIFTTSNDKFAILIKEANNHADAISKALVEANFNNCKYTAVEAVLCK